MFASPPKLMLPKSDGAGEVAAAVLLASVGVAEAAPKALLPKIEEVSGLAACDPKMLAGGDWADGFVSGEQIIKSLRTESVLGGDAGGVAKDEVVTAGFERSKPGAFVVGAFVAVELANENLK